jgi:serine/threonine protein kinase
MIGPPIDLYAVGCIAFEMLVGHTPWASENDIELLELHARAPIPGIRSERPDVPVSLEAWVKQLLAKVPSDRPVSAEAARASLRRLRDELHEKSPDRSRTALLDPISASVAPAAVTTELSMAPVPTTPMRPIPSATTVLKPHALEVDSPTPYETALRPSRLRQTVLLGSLAVAVATATFAGLWVFTTPPAPAEPAPKIEPPKLEPPRPAGPTAAQLEARIKALRGKARDRSVAMLLDDATDQLAHAKTEEDRRAVSAFLDDWEREFSK